MKRTLALILTLCMALSMFSFPALAAELDAAPLETAPVETQTTTPADAPAAAGDVVAPAAEAPYTVVTVTPDTVSDKTYDGQSVTVKEPTVGSGLVKDVDYTLSGNTTTVTDAGNYAITQTVTLTDVGEEKNVTFSNDANVFQGSYDAVTKFTISAYNFGDASNATVKIALTRENVGETPELTIESVSAGGITPAVASEILADVRAAYADDPTILSLTVGTGHDAITVNGSQLSQLADKTGAVTGTIKLNKTTGNWTADSVQVTCDDGLGGAAVEGTVSASWGSSYKYKADALTFNELKKGLEMGDGSAPTSVSMYMMTAEEKAKIDKANDSVDDRIAAYKQKTNLSSNTTALQDADAGNYVVYVEAASASMTGSACFNVTITGYSVSEVAKMLSMDPTAKTDLASEGSDTGDVVTSNVKEPVVTDPADTADCNPL